MRYKVVVIPSCAVTKISTVFAPELMDRAAEALPEVTEAYAFAFERACTVALEPAVTVGVTVIDVVAANVYAV